MSPEKSTEAVNLENMTELSLGIPGDQSRTQVNNRKRGFEESAVELTLGSSSACVDEDPLKNEISSIEKPPAKAQMVGWPPVKSSRKNMTTMKSRKFVKVGVDGVAYLRKIDLEMYGSYKQLLSALEDMFSCLITISNINKKDQKRSAVEEYEPTYEDRDGDWMLIGDVPWTMFVESCKKIRLRKRFGQSDN